MANLFDGIYNNSVGAAQVSAVSTQAASTPGSANIFDNAVLLSLELRVFGTSRRLKDSEFTVDASKEKTGASKRLLKSDELKAIGKFDAKTRQLVAIHTIPSQFRAGLYLLPIASIELLDAQLQNRKVERQVLVDAFCASYQDIKWKDSQSAAAGGLGGVYKESDYPDVEEVRAAFGMSYTYAELSAPGKLSSINMAIYERCKAEAQECWRDAIDEGKAMLRAGFLDLVTHMQDRLIPGADGKPKVFRDSLLKNTVDFLQTFDARNLAGDAELAALVSQCASMLNGVTPDDLRKSETVKARVQAGIEGIKAALDPMVADRPVRKITFDNDSDGFENL